MTAITVEQLRFGYTDKPIVDIETFRLEQGQSVAAIGPSGCGKTSFLHLLAGLLRPDSGEIALLGQSLAALSDTELDRFRGGNLGIVLQQFRLLRGLSVIDNLRLAGKLSRCTIAPERYQHLLKRLDIAAVADHKPSELSQGQAQRAAIARALVHKPSIVMADEPTSALDDRNAQEVIELLNSAVTDEGAALLVVTHDQRIRGTLDTDFDLGAIA
ncbi:MAG: ATP-binding cassette domain-containing protein [Pseudomonadota bacterium]